MSKSKYNIFALMVMALVMVRTAKKIDAFNISPPVSKAARPASTALFQQQQENNDQERRGFFASVKKLFGASVLVSGLGGKPLPALAEDTSASGNIVEIEVKNLDGGSAGTIKIQMKPDWAPRGVARFEVSRHYLVEFFFGVCQLLMSGEYMVSFRNIVSHAIPFDFSDRPRNSYPRDFMTTADSFASSQDSLHNLELTVIPKS